MPDSGVITATGEGSYYLGAAQLLSDLVAQLVTPGGKSVLYSTTYPIKVDQVGWYGIGWGAAASVPGNPPMVTWWKWLDFTAEDMFSLSNFAGQYTYADTLFWGTLYGATMSLQAFW